MKNSVRNLLKAKARLKKAEALTSFDLLVNNPAGVGEHSEQDYYDNLHNAYRKYLDAIDEINSIDLIFEDLSKL